MIHTYVLFDVVNRSHITNPNLNNLILFISIHRRSVRTDDIWCIFQKLKYVWVESEQVFKGLEFPVNETIAHYLNTKGYEDETALAEKRRIFGDNK